MISTLPGIPGRMQALVKAIEPTFPQDQPWIREAFLTVPRHRFIRRRGIDRSDEFIPVDRNAPTEEDLDAIYADRVVMIHQPPSSCSQPYVISKMLGWLDLRPGMKVLEIGTGSGFNAALLAEGTRDARMVYSIDIQAEVAAEAREHLAEAGYGGVNVRAGDGGFGWPEAAPFDRIIVTAGCPDIPPAWLAQLAEGGLLVMPLDTPPVGDLQLRLRRSGTRYEGGYLDCFYFMGLQGAFAGPPRAAVRAEGEPYVVEVVKTRPGFRCAMTWQEHRSFLLFARGQTDWFSRLRETWHKEGETWRSVTFDPVAGVALIHADNRLAIHGRPGPVWNLGALIERWKAMGKPAPESYRVEVETDPVRAPRTGDWIDHRASVDLRLRLPTPE